MAFSSKNDTPEDEQRRREAEEAESNWEALHQERVAGPRYRWLLAPSDRLRLGQTYDQRVLAPSDALDDLVEGEEDYRNIGNPEDAVLGDNPPSKARDDHFGVESPKVEQDLVEPEEQNERIDKKRRARIEKGKAENDRSEG